MIFYLSIIFLLSFFSYLEIFWVKSDKLSHSVLITLVVLVLIIHDGFRWETGTDWEAYLQQFNSVGNPNIVSLLKVEKGYFFLVYLVKLLSDNYTFFLVVHALILYFIFSNVMIEMSPYPVFSFLFYYTIFIGVLGMNRQLISIAICVYSLRYLVSGNRMKLVIFVLIASTFHISAFLFLIMLLFTKMYNPVSYLILIILALIIRETNLILYILTKITPIISPFAAQKLFFYIEKNESVGILSFILGLIRRLPVFIIFYYFREKFNDDRYYTVILNSYFMVILMVILFSNSFQTLLARGSHYFAFAECLLIPRIFIFISRGKLVAFSILILYALFNFFNSIKYYSDLFIPYKGILINQGYSRILY